MNRTRSWRLAIAPLMLAGFATTAIGASPAAAAETTRPALVHTPPNVPVVIDGVRRAPEAVQRFNGRALYFAVARKGKKLLAFTRADRYRAYLKRTAGVQFKPGTLEPAPVARSSRAGTTSTTTTTRRAAARASGSSPGGALPT